MLCAAWRQTLDHSISPSTQSVCRCFQVLNNISTAVVLAVYGFTKHGNLTVQHFRNNEHERTRPYIKRQIIPVCFPTGGNTERPSSNVTRSDALCGNRCSCLPRLRKREGGTPEARRRPLSMPGVSRTESCAETEPLAYSGLNPIGVRRTAPPQRLLQ